jgi:glucan phosphoethanolaminetransferase (alkaline phosphatase superfamily)
LEEGKGMTTPDIILLFIILVPVALFVIIRRRKDLKSNTSNVLLQILGVFLLVFGIIMLFPAFYLLFNGKTSGFNIAFVVLSFSMVFGGWAITKLAGKNRNPDNSF